MSRIWMLALVPQFRWGRWLCAVIIFLLMLALIAFAERSLASTGADTSRVFAWPPALFFCAIVAYIIPVFEFVTRRTESALDSLADELELSPESIAQARDSISRKSWLWQARVISTSGFFWLVQSWFLAGGFRGMRFAVTHSMLSFLMAVLPLLIWLTLTVATAALIDNARLFRRLTGHLKIDLLDLSRVAPVGRMAVHSTLVVIGAQALFPIMWISGPIDIWSTTPGMLFLTIAVVVLIVLPLWPLHQRLRQLKQDELLRVQHHINDARRHGGADQPWQNTHLTGLLSYRRVIHEISEWPVDFGAITRLLGYAVIVPLTWVGAAMIEMIVENLLN